MALISRGNSKRARALRLFSLSLFRPTPHFIAIPSLGIAYGRVPKVGNSAIKRTLAHGAGLQGRFPNKGFSKDRNWKTLAPDAYFVDAGTLRRDFPELLVFAFVREPLSRLASCYRSKLTEGRTIGKGLAREGLKTGISFPDFVDHVCRRGDWRSNVHYRSQSSILSSFAPDRNGSTPAMIGRFETMHRDWARISEAVEARTGRPLPRLPHRNPKHKIATAEDFFQGDAALTARAAARYAEDYRLFYPGQAPS